MTRDMAGGTGLVFDERMVAHDPGAGHPERPDRLRVLHHRFGDAAGLVRIGARLATTDEIARVHTLALVEQVAASAGRACTVFDPDTRTSAQSWDAARLAAGGLLELTDAVLDGQIANGVALVRPPGHHAERDRAMGFCLFNNVAIAAAHLRQRGVRRLIIVDWDLHHGNGTQHVFEHDPDVLYVSTHQYPFYPGTGALDEVGAGAGAGRTLNLPFPSGFGDAEFVRAFQEVVLPVGRQFAPEFVLVSAGFDADIRDPLGGLQVTPAGFAAMASACRQLADETAGGRIAVVLEGGYDLDAIGDGVETTLAVLRGATALPPLVTGKPHRFEPLLERLRSAHAPYWSF
jgi:acetoin utilization deacetylase AcuC-like enzyme